MERILKKRSQSLIVRVFTYTSGFRLNLILRSTAVDTASWSVMGHSGATVTGLHVVELDNYCVFWRTASHHINDVYSVENIRVSSVMKLYHVMLYKIPW